MKPSVFILLSFSITNIVLGQTYYISNNPTFDSVTIVPANPTGNDSVKLIVYISNEKDGRVFYKVCDSLGNCSTKLKISNDSIYIYELSMWPFSDTTEIFVDTVSLGKLDLEQYKIILINEESTLYDPTPPPGFIDTAIFTLPIILSLSEDKKEFEYSRVFPNPFSLHTVLETGNHLNNATLTVYNGFGQAVKQIPNISGRSVSLSRDNLPSGFYCIRLTQGNKIIVSGKLIITN